MAIGRRSGCWLISPASATRSTTQIRCSPDSASQTVSFVLDAASANIAMYAITSHALDREAHTREVQQYSQQCRGAISA